MADCEVKIEDIGSEADCPANDDRVLFTDAAGLSAMRTWQKIKECLNNGLIQRADLKFTIGDGGAFTPAVNTNQYSNPALAGVRFRVFRRGVGYLDEGVEFDILPAGGFKLKGADVFADQEMFHIQEYETIVQATDGGMFQGVIPINVDTLLDGSHTNCVMDISGGGNRVTITLPLLSSINKNTFWGFVADQQNDHQTSLVVSGTDKISFQKKLRGGIHIGQNERYVLVADVTRWIVLYEDSNYSRIGKPEFDWIVRPNTALAEGQQGFYIDFPRVPEFLQDNPDVAVSEIDWQANPVLQRGRFSLGDGLTWFRFPDLRGAGFRSLDKGRGLDQDTPVGAKPGRYQADELKLHDHSNGAANLLFPPSVPGTSHGIYATWSPPAPAGNYIRTGPSGLPILPVGGTETRGKNFGFNAIINI